LNSQDNLLRDMLQLNKSDDFTKTQIRNQKYG